MVTSNLTSLITIGKRDSTIIIYKVLFSQKQSIFNEETVIEKASVEAEDIVDREIAYCIYNNNLMNE